MCAPSPPQPTDPHETSAATTGTNVSTAVANANLNNVNQITPDGSLTYNKTGSYKWTDPYTGQEYEVPTFTATTALSEAGQRIHDTNLQTQQNLSTIGRDQSARIGQLLGTPVDLNNDTVEGRLMDLGMRRLNPIFKERQASAETDLINRGIRPGTDAYDRAHSVLSQAENDAIDNLLLKGRGQSVQEILAERNQPINEITALLSGGQVSQPNFINTNTTTIPTTDNSQIIGNYDNQRINIWQQQMAQQNAMMGNIFGLFGKMLPSDRRLKENVVLVGRTLDGQNIYKYNYIGSDTIYMGLMADEVERVEPEAVRMGSDGFYEVDYNMALRNAEALTLGVN